MPWSGEVISHAVILSCPVAACFAARVIARLTTPSEEPSVGLARQRSFPSLALSVSQREEPKRFREGDDILQYSNATFCYQSRDEGENEIDSEEDDLEFFLITPQQAQGALGDHATQFKKIYINGLTYVEQFDEQGTVLDSLSLDEYATRIQSVVGRVQSPDGLSESSSSCLSPRTGYPLEGQASACSVGSNASSLSQSFRSGFSSVQLSCTLDAAASPRTSFDFSAQGHTTLRASGCLPRYRSPLQPASCCASLDGRVSEAPSGNHPAAFAGAMDAASLADNIRSAEVTCVAHVSYPSRKASCSGKTSGHSPGAEQPQSSRTRRQTCEAPYRRRVPAAAAWKTPAAAQSPRSTTTTNTSSATKVPAPCRRRGLSTGGRPTPPPLPVPGPTPFLTPVACTTLSPKQSRACSQHVPMRRATTDSCLEKTPRATEPASSADLTESDESTRLRCIAKALYPRFTQGGALSAAHAVSPPLATRVPALPLPDGSTSDAEVPPALRYYLAQARAASVQHEVSEGGSDGSSCGSNGGVATGGKAQRRSGAGVQECPVSQPGFVRTTVEQLNTQRVVCCHVTPFAAAKTCRTPRVMTPKSSPVK